MTVHNHRQFERPHYHIRFAIYVAAVILWAFLLGVGTALFWAVA